MIVEEIDSYIGCADCSYGFTYTIFGLHCRLEKIYDTIFKHVLSNHCANGRCPHCGTGKLQVVRAGYKIKPAKQLYTAHWKCLICGQVWAQTEYIRREDISAVKSADAHFNGLKTTTCPNLSCRCTSRRLIGMSRS